MHGASWAVVALLTFASCVVSQLQISPALDSSLAGDFTDFTAAVVSQRKFKPSEPNMSGVLTTINSENKVKLPCIAIFGRNFHPGGCVHFFKLFY